MRIVCIGYRDWALKIYDKLSQDFDYNFLIIRNKNQKCVAATVHNNNTTTGKNLKGELLF